MPSTTQGSGQQCYIHAIYILSHANGHRSDRTLLQIDHMNSHIRYILTILERNGIT